MSLRFAGLDHDVVFAPLVGIQVRASGYTWDAIKLHNDGEGCSLVNVTVWSQLHLTEEKEQLASRTRQLDDAKTELDKLYNTSDAEVSDAQLVSKRWLSG